MAYSALGSIGISMWPTLGVWGRHDGRGILFDLEPPVVMNELQSCVSGKFGFVSDGVVLERTKKRVFANRHGCLRPRRKALRLVVAVHGVEEGGCSVHVGFGYICCGEG